MLPPYCAAYIAAFTYTIAILFIVFVRAKSDTLSYTQKLRISYIIRSSREETLSAKLARAYPRTLIDTRSTY